ncbi:MAG: hypothetical protein KF795_00290 [Labilithrix sp.]|nr:hypothetical protein [Labilithrix sp.]
MAATGNEEARFSVTLEDNVSGSAEDAAESLEALRTRVQGGENAIKSINAAMRRLRGDTDAVKKAKEELNAKLQAEKDKVSAASLAILKHGTTYEKLTEQSKKLNAKTKDLAFGPISSLKQKFAQLKEVFTSGSTAMNVATLAAAGLAAAVVAITVAVGAGAVSLARWVLNGANAARSAALMREAATGSAQQAQALGSQVDALANKVPTAKSALNDLAISLIKNGVQGQTLVDTFNAIGQASAALGDDAGAKLRELVERGRLSQRFYVNPLELQGTGIAFDDLARSLGEKMKGGVAAARQALREGRVSLENGAAALRTAVERKFGGVNLRKMFDLDVMGSKLRERFDKLTSGVNLEPLLRGLDHIASVFDDSTVSGATLKFLVETIGSGLAKSFEAVAPIAKRFIQGMIIGFLQIGIGVLQLRNWLRRTFGDSDLLKNIDLMSLALTTGKYVIFGVVSAVAILGVALAALAAAYAAPIVALAWLQEQSEAFGKYLHDLDWGALGRSIVDGLIDGITGRANALANTVTGLAEKVKSGFKSALGISSPSKVFAGFGANTADGYAQGVSDGTPAAARALDDMATTPAGGAAGARAGGAVTIHMPITIHAGGADAAKQLTSPAFLQQLTKALEEVLVSAGIPVSA